MNVIYRFTSIPLGLLDEVGSTTITLDGVYAVYAWIAVGAVSLWALGVLAFGRPGRAAKASKAHVERATPVAL